uniref:TFIIB-type domain-containing protein n=6 Tax=Triticinae TaxID=1648030 RepID=A0A453S145_AEGTS
VHTELLLRFSAAFFPLIVSSRSSHRPPQHLTSPPHRTPLVARAMESTCVSCGEGPVIPEPASGVLVCTACGVVHDAGADEFVNSTCFTEGGELDRRAATTVHHSSQSPYLDHKLYAASDVITSMAARFSLSASRVDEVLRIAQSATDRNLACLGTAFLPALAAACTLLVARSHRLPISFAEAAEAAACTTFALPNLVYRIASQLYLPPLPSFDYSAALERAVERSGKLTEAAGEKRDAILSQARFLLCCASKWSLTTGRHPLPLVAGVIAFAAELNKVTSVSVEDIALDISAVPHTSRLRYNELVAALVGAAQKLLPWGSDVNTRNLQLSAPILLQLMQMQSQSGQSEQFQECFRPDIASTVKEYSSVDLDESKYFQIDPLDVDDFDFKNYGQELKEPEDLKILEGCMSDTYQNILKRIAQLKELGNFGKVPSRRKRWKRELELEPWDNAQTKNKPLEEEADIDIGYDAPPPSFTAGVDLQKRRRARIEAAKCRINEIMKAPATRIANAIDSPSALGHEDVCPPQKNIRKNQWRKRRNEKDHLTEISNAPDCVKKRKKRDSCNVIDWEDCVIELLLLHGANEAEIEQGQYKRLLELRVFSA